MLQGGSTSSAPKELDVDSTMTVKKTNALNLFVKIVVVASALLILPHLLLLSYCHCLMISLNLLKSKEISKLLKEE